MHENPRGRWVGASAKKGYGREPTASTKPALRVLTRGNEVVHRERYFWLKSGPGCSKPD